MKVNGLVPARFLTITAHLVLVIVIFWSREPNVLSCLPSSYTQTQYDEKDLQMIIGLSVALGLFAIELVGFFGGLTMFTAFQSLLSMAAHSGASVALAYFIWRGWPCERYWYIFGVCSAFPAFTEILTIIMVLCCGRPLMSTAAHAGAAVALLFFLFDYWPCDWYWYIFGFCSAFPALTEIISIISVLRRSY